MPPTSPDKARRSVHAAVIVLVEKAARTRRVIRADCEAEALLLAFPACGMSAAVIRDEIARRASERLVSVQIE